MAVRLLWGMRRVPHLSRVGPLPDTECPRVSILVAARDEATGLPQALPTLLAQDYPDYEIIVVNDRSTDATPQILDDIARHDQKLKVINLQELPPGWLGKAHALTVAYQHAGGEWLAIADAARAGRPWVNLALFTLGLAMLAAGMRRAYRHPQQYLGRIRGPILAAIGLVLFGPFLSFWARTQNVSFQNGETKLCGILLKPYGFGPFPAVVFPARSTRSKSNPVEL